MLDRLRLFPLRFATAEVEAAFQADYVRRAVPLARAALALGLSQIALFGLLDRPMAPESYREILLIRAGMLAGVAGVLACTFAPWFRRRMQGVLAVAPLVTGFGVIGMSVVGHEAYLSYDYYAGVMITLVFVHVLIRLRFAVASAVGNVLIATFLAVSVATGTPALLVVNGAFYLCSTNLTGMVASYALERYARRVWADAQQQGRTNADLSAALADLHATQGRLVQAEKLAGLGRLTAGIGHEIKNPLNFVNNFAGLSVELVDELVAEAERRPDLRLADVRDVLSDLRTNAAKIHAHGHRADAVVRGMMEHARGGRAERQPFDLNAAVEAHVALAVEGRRAPSPAGAAVVVERDYDPAAGAVEGSRQDVGRVVLNLVQNALDAVAARAAGAGAPGAPPRVAVRTRRAGGRVTIEVEDNGCGIPEADRARLFEPFFTTKRAGGGNVGLGLSLSRDVVVHGHGGTLEVESAEGVGTTFTVTLPARAPEPVAPA